MIPNDLATHLEVFRAHLPTVGTKGLAEVWMFRDLRWFSVLLEMHFDFAYPTVSAEVRNTAAALIERKRRTVEELRGTLPNHYEYLREHVYRAA